MPHPGLKVATSPTFDGRLSGKVIMDLDNNMHLDVVLIFNRNWSGIQAQSPDSSADDFGAGKSCVEENQWSEG